MLEESVRRIVEDGMTVETTSEMEQDGFGAESGALDDGPVEHAESIVDADGNGADGHS